ncbi:hypothetical protein AB0B56_41900 [Streptosporangium canum]|uniref:hypothetical protein n=1 Tax=Streptosporangium canum TaxID=324952 RepID=UPI003442F933
MSYTNHYRRGLIKLLDVLEFRSSNQSHRPVIEALVLVARYANAGNTTYYPLGETVPVHKAMGGDWAEVVHRTDKRGLRRVVRMVYEVVAFQALRDQLKCKEVWVVGADKWRDPDEDLPRDFEARRGLTPLFWSHVRPYGEVNLDMCAHLDLAVAAVPGPG